MSLFKSAGSGRDTTAGLIGLPHATTLAVGFLVALGTVVFPIVAGVPAEASTTKYGCTVTPSRPVKNSAPDIDGRNLVVFRVEAKCDQQTRLQIQLMPIEDDGFWGDDDPFGPEQPKTFDLGTSFGGVRFYVIRVPDFDGDTVAEVYQKVRFRVHNGRNEWLPYTQWESSPTTSIRLYN